MLFADFRKKRQRNAPSTQAEPVVVAESPHDMTDDTPVPGLVAAGKDDDDLSGVELKAYARKNELPTEKVWDLIRTGKLVARTENGFVYVYGSSVPVGITGRMPMTTNSESDADDHLHHALPPLPQKDERNALAVVHHSSAEVALLMDHLSLAKEQNLEILRMTQQSVEQMRSMTEQIISSKNEILTQKDVVIHAKEAVINKQNEELATLRQQLDEEKLKQRRLKQDLEDMEMLTKTLGL